MSGPAPSVSDGDAAVPVERNVALALHRATFNAAAANFDDPRLGFWERVGRRTVELSGVFPGSTVLDVCCGTGACTLPAAELAGPRGRVLGIDLAEIPLARAHRKAEMRGLANVDLVQADMMRLDHRTVGTFDIVSCVLGLYYATEPADTLARLWGCVRPGGSLIVTTWGCVALEPLNTVFRDAVTARQPLLGRSDASWERMNTSEVLTGLFVGAGAAVPIVHHESLRLPTTPRDAWTVVLGSGYRLLVDVMSSEDAAAVQRAVTAALEARKVVELRAEVLYARADKAPEAG